jgi:hypothetical protein
VSLPAHRLATPTTSIPDEASNKSRMMKSIQCDSDKKEHKNSLCSMGSDRASIGCEVHRTASFNSHVSRSAGRNSNSSMASQRSASQQNMSKLVFDMLKRVHNTCVGAECVLDMCLMKPQFATWFHVNKGLPGRPPPVPSQSQCPLTTQTCKCKVYAFNNLCTPLRMCSIRLRTIRCVWVSSVDAY